MRYVIVPEPIQLRNLVNGALGDLFPIKLYATNYWFDDNRWQTPPSNLARLVNVMKEFNKAPGQVMEFEDADFAILHSIVTTPAMGVNQVTQQAVPILPPALVSIQLEPYRQLFLTATNVKPDSGIDGVRDALDSLS